MLKHRDYLLRKFRIHRLLHSLESHDTVKASHNTALYIQIADAIYKETIDEFTVKATSQPEEIKGLLEVDFEYVCKHYDLMYFRKRN